MARTLKCDTIMVPGSQAANITMSSSVTNFGTIDVDINGGTINGCTLNNNSITVPSGNTFHIANADSLTTSTAQNDYIITNSTPFTLSNNNNDVEIAGDLKVTGDNIKGSSGNNTFTMDGSDNVTILGDLTVSGNDISCGNATMNLKPNGATRLSITTDGDVAITRNLTVTGNIIKDSGGGDTITMSGTNDVTIGGDLTVTGGDIITGNNSLKFTANTNLGMELTTAGALIVDNDITAFGTPSDERMKENIDFLQADDIIQDLMKFDVRQFTYKQEYQNHPSKEGVQIGFIAQELEKVLPEAVQTKDDGMKAINYDVLVAILFKALQQLYLDAVKMNTSLVKGNTSTDTATDTTTETATE